MRVIDWVIGADSFRSFAGRIMLVSLAIWLPLTVVLGLLDSL